MSNIVTIHDNVVELTVKGWSKLWALKSSIKLPREAITRVYVRPEDLRPPWLRMPGTHIPLSLIHI